MRVTYSIATGTVLSVCMYIRVYKRILYISCTIYNLLVLVHCVNSPTDVNLQVAFAVWDFSITEASNAESLRFTVSFNQWIMNWMTQQVTNPEAWHRHTATSEPIVINTIWGLLYIYWTTYILYSRGGQTSLTIGPKIWASNLLKAQIVKN